MLTEAFDHVEYEIKFGAYDGGLNKTQYALIKNQFKFKPVQVSHFFSSTIKKSIIDNEVVWFTKTLLNTFHYDYPVTLNINKQEVIPAPDHFKSTYIKDKLKLIHTLNIHNQVYTIELSESTIYNDGLISPQYEIDLIVMVNTMTDDILQAINDLILHLLKLMNKTEVIYTIQEYQQLKETLSQYDLTTNKPKAITLKYQFNTPYIVSTKAKGIKALLVIHTTGLWLINQYYNLLTKYKMTAWTTTIFDGTLIKPIEGTKHYWYLGYDCFVFNNNSMRAEPYYQRIDKAIVFRSLYQNTINPDYFTFTLKTTRVFTTDKYLKMREILNLNVNYKRNGLIFTSPYSYNEPIYKWIIPSEVTIDFAVYNQRLYLYNQQTLQDEEFKGIPAIPFDETMMLSLPLNPNKYIAECRWDQAMNKMILVKIRDDKTNADEVELAIENWKIQNDPVVGSCQ